MPEIQDMGLRYGGRIRCITVWVNTDEDDDKLFGRVQRAARGIKMNAVLMTCAKFDGERGEEVWADIQQVVRAVAAHPKSETVDFSKDEEK